jgi:hypothetical protein
VLSYARNRAIRLATWNRARGEIDAPTLIPKGVTFNKHKRAKWCRFVLGLAKISARKIHGKKTPRNYKHMLEETVKRRPNRIFYPRGSWFPLQNEVFETVFPKLREKRSPYLYIALYRRAQRHPLKPFSANLTDLGKMIHSDSRTVRSCIIKLVGEGFVRMDYEGRKLRSRTDKAELTVPLAAKKLESGGWFPVPKFLVTDYLPKYQGSVVLIALLYHQHFRWKDYCWVGVETLSKVLGMKERRVYAYLHTMGHEHLWKRLGTGLPWPLKITYSPDGKQRHFSVRAAQYYTPLGRKKPVVKLREEFAVHFGYQKKSTVNDTEED